jgi:hypothetical protein
MTNRANLDMQGFAHGGAGLKSATATAGHGYFLIIWMNVWFHEMILSLQMLPARCLPISGKAAYYPPVANGMQQGIPKADEPDV